MNKTTCEIRQFLPEDNKVWANWALLHLTVAVSLINTAIQLLLDAYDAHDATLGHVTARNPRESNATARHNHAQLPAILKSKSFRHYTTAVIMNTLSL